MGEKLIVKNFGPILDATLDLRKTTVFIGPQGSGKSTLAKLIAIFSDSAQSDFYLQVKNIHRINQTFFDLFKDYNIHNYFSSDTNIQFITGSLSRPFTVTVQSNSLSISDESRNEVYSGQDIHSYTLAMAGMGLNHLVYIPAERFLIPIISEALFGLLKSGVSLPGSLLTFGDRFEKARNGKSEYNIQFLNASYRFEDGRDRIFSEGQPTLLLSESSSGLQALIPLQVVIEHLHQEKDFCQIFIVEEPELHLYPTTQKDLISYLTNRCTKDDNELVITTHSPYVLSAFSNLLFAYQVAQKHPDKVEEIKQIIPQESWLNPSEFNAYYVGEGTVRQIFNEKTGVIGENELDEVSEDLGGEFDALMEIYSSVRPQKPGQ